MKVTVKATGSRDIRGLDPQKYIRELERVAETHANRVKKDFDGTVATWRRRPSFPVKKQDTASDIVRFIGPSGPNKERFNWVHEGVAPRFIRPRRAPMLRFQRGYIAATTPGKLGSRTAKRFGPWVSSKGFRWPGIQPRDFSTVIRSKREGDFFRDVQNAISRAARG